MLWDLALVYVFLVLNFKTNWNFLILFEDMP